MPPGERRRDERGGEKREVEERVLERCAASRAAEAAAPRTDRAPGRPLSGKRPAQLEEQARERAAERARRDLEAAVVVVGERRAEAIRVEKRDEAVLDADREDRAATRRPCRRGARRASVESRMRDSGPLCGEPDSLTKAKIEGSPQGMRTRGDLVARQPAAARRPAEDAVLARGRAETRAAGGRRRSRAWTRRADRVPDVRGGSARGRAASARADVPTSSGRCASSDRRPASTCGRRARRA